jgi:hypothetical protein
VEAVIRESEVEEAGIIDGEEAVVDTGQEAVDTGQVAEEEAEEVVFG